MFTKLETMYGNIICSNNNLMYWMAIEKSIQFMFG